MRGLLLGLLLIGLLTACSDSKKQLFSPLSKGRTGVDFRNLLIESPDLNVLNYQYFYNGSGVAVGDINNDGLSDLCFAGNMVKNRLYLNQGNFKFKDITLQSTIADKQGWCTGVTMVDINQDGWLDIYICRSADVEAARRKNLLFINNKDLTFTESAEQYGLDDEGYSTHASFFDMDRDGDLDMFVLNHSTNEYAGFRKEMTGLKQQKNELYGSKLYRNDGGNFSNVTEEAGITSNVLSFGLGLAVFDSNNDGWLDIYVSNDFNEEDYLFVNQQNGTFKEQVRDAFDYVSLFSMGCDAADFNNDGKIDLATLDMLPEDNATQKMHSGAENYDKVQMLFQNGFHYQFSRNMLQLNNGDGTFSEMGQLAGVSNTDWSWSALFADYDLDGQKDLFVTNGYVKDYTNMDFLRFSAELASESERKLSQKELIQALLEKMPGSKTENYMFHNRGDLHFAKVTKDWGLAGQGFSSGAAYADLDNDGDLDLVINKIDEAAGLYRNNAETLTGNQYLKIQLQDQAPNIEAIGTQVKVFTRDGQQIQQQMPSRGYASSVERHLIFGLGKNKQVDSIVVVWNDGQKQVLNNVKSNQTLQIKKAQSLLAFAAQAEKVFFLATNNLSHQHLENKFQDFKTQPLLPHFLSRCGPHLAKGDVNGDGREDVYIGAAKGSVGVLYMQASNGNWVVQKNTPFQADAGCEDSDALFFDADGDKDLDLYVASGGYEFAENDPALQDRLYVNDGRGNFSKNASALPAESKSAACVRAADVDRDGDQDLFIGGYVIPSKYPLAPASSLLINNGKGQFSDQSASLAPAFAQLGMVRDACWADLNQDRQMDLIVVGEWMPVQVFIQQKGQLQPSNTWSVEASSGWWNRLVAADFDQDGDLDLVAGNLGTNAQFKASIAEPVTLHYKDFMGSGAINPILCYFIGGKSYPAASRDDLLEQLVFLKKKYTSYAAYANATLNDVFSKEQLQGAQTLDAVQLQSCYFENTGKGFEMQSLCPEAQFSPIYALESLDVNADGHLDLVAAGNNQTSRVKFGHYSANHGLVLLGNGKGKFKACTSPQSGLKLRADVRDVIQVKTATGTQLIFGINDQAVQTYRLGL
ncbi:VCBS repeat-containing protein [Haliscomenobacter sp.]|uniref:VCBS repeat-containing protein n=1 Tax=Haliscomenobacter sp. TaxID=2717303 RepID=UPI003BAAFAC3